MKIKLTEIVTESYKNLGARLFHLCRSIFKESCRINIAISFSEHVRGLGHALLWFTKHFSSYPIEISQHNGNANLQELSQVID